MKKLAFTLSEMIVAIAVVGIIAAATAPLINNIIPDKKKIAVIKIYKLLTNINAELLEDKGLYFQNGCNGLNCTDSPLNWRPSDEQRGAGLRDAVNDPSSKYIALLADYLKATDINGIIAGETTGSFTTIDGFNWSITQEDNSFSLNVNIDPERDTECNFININCDDPNLFQFIIAPTGKVFGGDPLTITYLKNPHNLSDRANDFKFATEYKEQLLKELEEDLKEEEEKGNQE